MGESGIVGVTEKALPAAEQFLFARYFMHRVVYYHKTTFGFEEACRQLLRRVRDNSQYDMPQDAEAVKAIVTSDALLGFTDAFVDRIIQKASRDNDDVTRVLAKAILSRQPPKLLKEVLVLRGRNDEHHAGTTFRQHCMYELASLAKKFGYPLGRFFLCRTRPLALEKRGPFLTMEEARDYQQEEREELIKVFVAGKNEPQSIVEINQSMIGKCSGYQFEAHRLYFVRDSEDEGRIRDLKDATKDWGSGTG